MKEAVNEVDFEERNEDIARISQIVLASKVVNLLAYVLLLLFLSFYSGLFWYVISYSQILTEGIGSETFLEEFDLLEIDNVKRTISLMYFAFTTLSTVGLGDYHPISNLERVTCAFLMLFGVMITTFVIEQYSKMVKEIRDFN